MEKKETPKNLLEEGSYTIEGPDNGEIKFDKITLNASSGAKRIWKVQSFSEKEIILKIEKFG